MAEATPTSAPGSATTQPPPDSLDHAIDPSLADLPAPPHHQGPSSSSRLDVLSSVTNGEGLEMGNGENLELNNNENTELNNNDPVDDLDIPSTSFPPTNSNLMGITASIASAPNPRPSDFNYSTINEEQPPLDSLDVEALTADGAPGSPTARLMRAIAPHNAAQADAKWNQPPTNASVNLFIGRALLANGNDNWPLKPNDIVNWIRKNYPSEWDGDEGRCSAHRVRTYLARKGADMYYEKLNQGSLVGWRIRQNHLWRFENGGFQGRGMKQEEAIAQAQKENDMIVTAAHKAAAAEALAAGHPGVKVSMSAPGVADNSPAAKRQRIRASGQARRKSMKKLVGDENAEIKATFAHDLSASPYYQPNLAYAHAADLGGSSVDVGHGLPIDPTLASASQHHDNGVNGHDSVDINMNLVRQAMDAAAAGQIDDLDMGMQIPVEMQMHQGPDGEGEDGDEARYGRDYGYGGGHGGEQHPYAPHQQYGYSGGQGQVYGSTGYQQGQ